MSEFVERILEKHSPEVVFLIGSGASKGLCNLPTSQDFFKKAGIRPASGWTFQEMYALQVSAYEQGNGEEISKVFNQIQEIKPESLLENILALFQLKNKKEPDLEEFYTFLLEASQKTIALLKEADETAFQWALLNFLSLELSGTQKGKILTPFLPKDPVNHSNEQNRLQPYLAAETNIKNALAWLTEKFYEQFNVKLKNQPGKTVPDIPEKILTTYLKLLVKNTYKTIYVFTTNYDNVLDIFFEELNQGYADDNRDCQVLDGFSPKWRDFEWNPEAYCADPHSRKNILYFKMHGSITWIRKKGEIVRQTNGLPPDDGDAVLVPPLLGKPSLAGEFKFMYQCFEKALRSTKKLVIIGQSLRDEEIGNYVKDALSGGEIKVIAICGSDPKDSVLSKLSQEFHGRFKLVSGGFPESLETLEEFLPIEEASGISG